MTFANCIASKSAEYIFPRIIALQINLILMEAPVLVFPGEFSLSLLWFFKILFSISIWGRTFFRSQESSNTSIKLKREYSSHQENQSYIHTTSACTSQANKYIGCIYWMSNFPNKKLLEKDHSFIFLMKILKLLA